MRDIYWVPQPFEEVGDDVVAIVESRGQGKQSGMDTRALVVLTHRLTRLEASGESAQRAPELLCRL